MFTGCQGFIITIMDRGEDARIRISKLLGRVLQATLSVLYPSLNNSLYNLPLMGKGDRRKATVDEV